MYLCIIGIIVAIFGIIAIIVVAVTGSRIMFLIYAGLIAIVFSLVKIKNCVHFCPVCT